MTIRDRLLNELTKLRGDIEVLLAEVNDARAVLGLAPLKMADIRAQIEAAEAAAAAKYGTARVAAVSLEERIRDEATAEAEAHEARGDVDAARNAWARRDEAEARRVATAASASSSGRR